jgi:hypothetical protein
LLAGSKQKGEKDIPEMLRVKERIKGVGKCMKKEKTYLRDCE